MVYFVLLFPDASIFFYYRQLGFKKFIVMLNFCDIVYET